MYVDLNVEGVKVRLWQARRDALAACNVLTMAHQRQYKAVRADKWWAVMNCVNEQLHDKDGIIPAATAKVLRQRADEWAKTLR